MKSIKNICCLILILFLFGQCNDSPGEQYSDELLIAVLTDFHHLQSVSSRIPSGYEKRDSILNVYKGQIAEIHDISVDEIDKILMYLESDLDRTKILYDSITKSLSFKK